MRIVKAANATNSRIVGGEVFQVPGTETQSTSITQNLDFTALFVVENFIPGNYADRKLCWTDGHDHEKPLPIGATITMMEVSEESKVIDYWYYKVQTPATEVDLTSFHRMSGSAEDTYQYKKMGFENETLRYLL